MTHHRRLFHILLYLVPAMMDCVAGIFLFLGPVRAALLGYDILVAGSMVTARCLSCAVTSAIVSRFLTPRNAVAIMFASIVMLFGVCMLGLWATNLAMLYVTSGVSGIFMIAFSSAFQVFMKIVGTGDARPLSRVVGFYTLSWCLGQACGPFITGFLMEIGKPADGVGLSVGWLYAYLVGGSLIAASFFALLWIRSRSADALRLHLAAAPADAADVREGRGKPDLAWLGWVMAVVGAVALGTVRGVFPSGVTRAGMPEWRTGLMSTLVALAMGLFAYAVSRGRDWAYSGKTMFRIGVTGCAGLAFFTLPHFMGWGLIDHYWQFYVACALFGCYSGTCYLYTAFHSLAHPDKSGRNISLSESFLAGGQIGGPIVGGWLAQQYGFYLPFGLCAVLVLGLGFFQRHVHSLPAWGAELPVAVEK